MDPKFRPEWICLPGYLGMQNFLTHSLSIQEAFGRLDIFDARSAEEFLSAPIEALAKRAKEGRMGAEDFTEVTLLFALMSVVADRERRDEESRYRTQVLAAKVSEQGGGQESGDDSIPF